MTITSGGGPAAIGNPKLAGTVSVYTRAGKLVARRHVKQEHGLTLKLVPGRYLANSGRQLHPRLGCKPVAARIKSSTTTTVQVLTNCDIP